MKLLLFIGFLILLLVIGNIQEGLAVELTPPNYTSIDSQRKIFEALLKIKEVPMLSLEKSSLLSQSFRNSINDFIHPTELSSKTFGDVYASVELNPEMFRENIKFIQGITTSTTLNQLLLKKDLFFVGFDKLITEIDTKEPKISSSSTIGAVIDELKV